MMILIFLLVMSKSGTDSAPHVLTNKHSACGCAGVFTGHAAIELYAEAFDSGIIFLISNVIF